MGLDMYLYCNSKELSKKVADAMYCEDNFQYKWAVRLDIGVNNRKSIIGS